MVSQVSEKVRGVPSSPIIKCLGAQIGVKLSTQFAFPTFQFWNIFFGSRKNVLSRK